MVWRAGERDPGAVTEVVQNAPVPDRPRPKTWAFEKVVSEHAFDKLRAIDCTLGEFDLLLDAAEVIEEIELELSATKELLLAIDWSRPLHVVVVVDAARREERLVTVYEPDADRWTNGYRRRR